MKNNGKTIKEEKNAAYRRKYLTKQKIQYDN